MSPFAILVLRISDNDDVVNVVFCHLLVAPSIYINAWFPAIELILQSDKLAKVEDPADIDIVLLVSLKVAPDNV